MLSLRRYHVCLKYKVFVFTALITEIGVNVSHIDDIFQGEGEKSGFYGAANASSTSSQYSHALQYYWKSCSWPHTCASGSVAVTMDTTSLWPSLVSLPFWAHKHEYSSCSALQATDTPISMIRFTCCWNTPGEGELIPGIMDHHEKDDVKVYSGQRSHTLHWSTDIL